MAVSKVFVQKTTAEPPPSNDPALFGSQPQHRDAHIATVVLQGRPSTGCCVSACSDDKGMPRPARSSTPSPASVHCPPPNKKDATHNEITGHESRVVHSMAHTCNTAGSHSSLAVRCCVSVRSCPLVRGQKKRENRVEVTPRRRG